MKTKLVKLKGGKKINNKEEAMKEEILAKTTPLSLVPLATGTAFLILGSRGTNACPGHPSLPTFLLLAGTLTVGLGILNQICKFVIFYGLSDGKRSPTPQEKNVVWLLTHLQYLLSWSQVIILIVGTVIVAPLATRVHAWNYEDPDHPFYCDYGTVIFAAIFFPSAWFLLLLTLVAYLLIRFCRPHQPPQ